MTVQPSSGDNKIALICKALAHPVRVQMFRRLAEREAYCGDLVQLFGFAQSTVSHHLKALREAGLIEGEEHGPSVCYNINRRTFEEFKTLVSHLL